MKRRRSNKFVFGTGTVFSIFAIAIMISSAIAVPVVNDASENPDIEVNDETVLMTELDLPALEGAIEHIENEVFKDILEQIVEVIKEKGSVNSNDIEDILSNSNTGVTGVHIACDVYVCGWGRVFGFPGFLRSFVPGVPYFNKGGVIWWYADADDLEIDIGGEKGYKGHSGVAVPFWGVIINTNLDPEDNRFEIIGASALVLIIENAGSSVSSSSQQQSPSKSTLSSSPTTN